MEKGRNCSLDYILKKDWISESIDGTSETIYIVGGLYGNSFALDIINKYAKKENAQIIFNGDMHWFDVREKDFFNIELASQGVKLLGNVEYELISNNDNLGCGCNYPEDVDSGVVERSNVIHRIMKENLKDSESLKDIKIRNKTCVINFFNKKIAITHGDEKSMSGWDCSHDNLQKRERQEEISNWLEINNIDILATTHTCLPVIYNNGRSIVINNGAAGMANIKDSTYGLITRISKKRHENSIVSEKIDDIYVELLKIDFDIKKFLEWFEKVWSEESPASISYKNRIVNGTSLEINKIKV